MPREHVARRDEQIFVVRTWREHGAAGDRQRRASVTHVVSGERRYFRTFEELSAFIERLGKYGDDM